MTSTWRRLLPYTRPHRASLAMVLVLMLLGIGLELLRPWPMKLLVDQVFAQRALSSAGSWVPKSLDAMDPVSIVALLAGSTVAIFIGIQLATIARTHLQVGVGARMSYELGADLFTHFQQLSATYHAKTQVGDLTRRVVTDATCARDMIVAVAVPASAAVVRVVAMAVVMWRLDPFLALCALSVTPVTLVLIRKFDATIAQRTYTWQQREGDILAHAEQTFSALPVVQAFGREEDHTNRFLAHARRSLDAMMSATRMQVAFKLSVSAVSAIGTALILMIGGFRTLNGNITAGELLVFISYLAALYAPVETLAYSSAGYAAAVARARRVFEVLDATEVVAERPGARVLTRAEGAIALDGVSFGYDAARPVLQDVTLHVAPGEVVALVGATGAGKSTLVGLVPRFFDPWAGRVCIDGQDVRELTVASVRAQVALVLQEPFLLPLTVAENIAYGRPGATMAEIEAAARAANAHEFIERLPQGYATVLAERGASLSGGQQQRLSIARALLKDAPILILDEPTSALDAETEGLLLDALGRLMKGRTTLIIAHRLTTIRTADRIVAMAQGRIVEQGSHDQLLAHDGVYAALYQSQFRHTLSEQPEAMP